MEEKINSLMSSMGMNDMSIPELKINQATGGEYAKATGAKLGQLYNSTTNEVYDSIDVQILHIQKNRTFWGRSDITDDPPICSSLDGITSVDGKVCKTCSNYRERASLDKEERRKECQQGFVVMGIDENGMPLIIRLNGISAEAGRNLVYQAYWNKALKANPGGFFWRVTSALRKTSAGNAYEFKFNLLKDRHPTPEAITEYNRIVAEMGLLPTGVSAPVAALPTTTTPSESEDINALYGPAPTPDRPTKPEPKPEPPIDDIKF